MAPAARGPQQHAADLQPEQQVGPRRGGRVGGPVRLRAGTAGHDDPERQELAVDQVADVVRGQVASELSPGETGDLVGVPATVSVTRDDRRVTR